jgi:hypothetical protein
MHLFRIVWCDLRLRHVRNCSTFLHEAR